LQALLVYAIIAFFWFDGESPDPLVDETTVMRIQQVAYRLATNGLFIQVETDHTRPKWEEWIIVSAKRRTILTLYCFDCVFTTAKGLPTFPCDELTSMPAPAGKILWQAQSREQWERAYDQWLVRWSSGTFLVGDLMRKSQPGPRAEDRLQQWLSEVDEFGLMTMVVIHSGRSM
jgi:hypothetical protein